MDDCGMGFSWNLFGITMNDMMCFSKVTSRAQSLESLELRSNLIDDELCKVLCIGLKDCPGLRSLSNMSYIFILINIIDLSHNRIQDEGSRAIATLLASNETSGSL